MAIESKTLPFHGMDDHDGFSLDAKYAANLRNVRSLRDRIVRAPGGTLLADTPTPGFVAMKTSDTLTSNATGSVVYTHSLASIPVGFVFYALRQTDSGNEDELYCAMGMSDGTDTRSMCIVAADGTNTAPITTTSSTAAIFMLNEDGTTFWSANLTAFDASTFTLNWTTVDTTRNWRFFWYVLGCPGASGKLLEWTLNASAGNDAVTGAGFAPQGVLHLVKGPAGATSLAAIGVGAQDSSHQWAVGTALSLGTLVDAATFQSTTACIGLPQVSPEGGTTFVGIRANAVSLDADGFTVKVITPPVSPRTVWSLCLAGFGGLQVGSYTKTALPAPTLQTISGIAFQPDSLINAGWGGPMPEATKTGVNWIYGHCTAFRGVSNLGIGLRAEDGTSSISAKSTISRGQYGVEGEIGCYVKSTLTGEQAVAGQVSKYTSDGWKMNWIINDTSSDVILFMALKASSSIAGVVGIPRNYPEVYVGLTDPAADKYLMLTSKSAYIYVPTNESTGTWSSTSEVYTANAQRRFSWVNTLGIAAWSQGVDVIRQWDGTTFGNLVTTGTNHAARALIAFADRIVSIRPTFGGTEKPTQIRWSMNGNVNNWSGAGSGALEVIETSQDPLVTGFVLADRAFLAKRREIIELIWTGSTSPVFGTVPRIRGMGVLAPHSVGLAEQVAFWLGPDDIYMFDGSTLTAIGDRVYNTIMSFIDYNELDDVQGAVYTPDSHYYLAVPPYMFVYDYRRDSWYWDDMEDFAAIGNFQVGINFSLDINRSQFIVVGNTAAQTVRVDFGADDWLGVPIDAYFETRDYTADDILSKKPLFGGTALDLWNLNSLREIRFQAIPSSLVEVGISLNRGETWETTEITVNTYGTGVAWFQRAFNQIRFRFRSLEVSSYQIRGSWAFDVETSGANLPGT